MEVIVVRKPEDAAPIVADAYSALIAAKPDAVLGLATGSTPLGVYKVANTSPSRGGSQLRPVRRRSTSTSTSGCPPATPSLPHVHRARGHRSGRLRPRRRPRPRRARRGPGAGRARLRPGHPGRRRRRHADPGHRLGRAPGLQRAGLVLGLAHAGEDAYVEDPRRQRPVLRRGHQPGAEALPHAGPRHDHGVPARDPAWPRVRQGPGRGRAAWRVR